MDRPVDCIQWLVFRDLIDGAWLSDANIFIACKLLSHGYCRRVTLSKASSLWCHRTNRPCSCSASSGKRPCRHRRSKKPRILSHKVGDFHSYGCWCLLSLNLELVSRNNLCLSRSILTRVEVIFKANKNRSVSLQCFKTSQLAKTERIWYEYMSLLYTNIRTRRVELIQFVPLRMLFVTHSVCERFCDVYSYTKSVRWQ